MKVIDSDENSPRDISMEITYMKLMRHPNVVRCYDVFLKERYVNIVVDLFAGGDLVDGLNAHKKRRGLIPNAQLANLCRQLLASIAHVHNVGIVHRDIKPENFLADRSDIGDPECKIALADFGAAQRLDPGSYIKIRVGTQLYWAPEVWDFNYDFRADVWAAGITVHLLLTGGLPFADEAAIRSTGSFVVPHNAEKQCVDFLRTCLEKDMERRPVAKELAKHNWLQTPLGPPPKDPTYVNSAVSGCGTTLSCLGGCVAGIAVCLYGMCSEIVTHVRSSGENAAIADASHANLLKEHDELPVRVTGVPTASVSTSVGAPSSSSVPAPSTSSVPGPPECKVNNEQVAC
jgi:serine/threonine protein kinase